MSLVGPQPRDLGKYGWALLAAALAILARWLAAARLGTHLPYGSVLIAAMIIAWFRGTRPALLVVGVGGIAVNFLLLPPYWSFHSEDPQQRWGLVLFYLLGTIVSLLGGYVQDQRARAEATSAAFRVAEIQLRDAQRELERRVDERTAELARTNDSLSASEERFRLLVEGVKGYAMLMLDGDAAIVAWNGGAETLFERRADVVGANITQLIPSLDVFTLIACAHGGSSERQALRAGGSFPIELEVTPLDPYGIFVVIVHDISERKSLEAANEQKQRRADELRRKSEELEAENQRMREATRAQSEFLANMSHELRTPLNAIVGFADVLHSGMAGPLGEQQREFLGDILTSSRHLLQLINDLLDLAKVQSGALEVNPEPVELGRAISEVRDILRGLAAERHLELDVQLPADLGWVTVDPAKLRQILYNYVSNALKFTAEGGRVTIRAELIDSGFRIEVEDTGIGIASEDLRYLFVAYRQLDGSAAKRYPGTGLGLALTKRLAEAHGGTVGVRSERGVGSTFWVELPRVAGAIASQIRAMR